MDEPTKARLAQLETKRDQGQLTPQEKTEYQALQDKHAKENEHSNQKQS